MKRDWKCWQDDETEDDAHDVIGCWDPEEAAREYVDGLVSFPDWADRINGEPFTVFVLGDDGELTKWEVQASTTVDVSARQIQGDEA